MRMLSRFIAWMLIYGGVAALAGTFCSIVGVENLHGKVKVGDFQLSSANPEDRPLMIAVAVGCLVTAALWLSWTKRPASPA